MKPRSPSSPLSLRLFCLVAAWWIGCLLLRAAPPSPPKSKPDAIIYEGSYPGWPWVIRTRDGLLLCVFREGTEHDYSSSGQALLCRSDDQGRTWSKPSVVVDAPAVDDRNVAITELPNRDLLVVYNTYTAARESLAMHLRSTDGGRSWSQPAPIGERNTRTRAAAVVLTNGTLLLPYYVAPGNGALAARSSDNGRSWTTVPVPDAPDFVGDEWDLLEAAPDRLVGILRNNAPKSDGFFWQTESRDGGRHWSIPRKTNVQSRRATAPAQIAWHNRTPILLYPDRRMVSVSAVKTTDPDFTRWEVDQPLVCYVYNPDESPLQDASYPVSVQLDSRRRLIVDYEIRPASRRIAAYCVEFPAGW